MLQLAAGLVEHFAEPQLDRLQLRSHTLEFDGRQRRENMVLTRVSGE